MVDLGHRERAEQVVAGLGHLPDKVAMGQPMGQAVEEEELLTEVVVPDIKELFMQNILRSHIII
jgi:hypothetical protein